MFDDYFTTLCEPERRRHIEKLNFIGLVPLFLTFLLLELNGPTGNSPPFTAICILKCSFCGSTAYKNVVLFFSACLLLTLSHNSFNTSFFFCYKSEITRRPLPTIESQWRALDSPPPPPPKRQTVEISWLLYTDLNLHVLVLSEVIFIYSSVLFNAQ